MPLRGENVTVKLAGIESSHRGLERRSAAIYYPFILHMCRLHFRYRNVLLRNLLRPLVRWILLTVFIPALSEVKLKGSLIRKKLQEICGDARNTRAVNTLRRL